MNNISKPIYQEIDVIGIGNAIVDILVFEKDSWLKKNSLNKGNMSLINEEEAEKLYSQIIPNLETSGGSAANTLAGIAQLGGKAAFIGRVRDDKLGEIFTNDIRSSGSIFQTPPTLSGPSTARCLILVTPDAQRTMCTYLGASTFLEPNDLDLSLIEKSKILYLEGYLFDSPDAKKAFIKASEICKNSGGEVALSLSDSFCVNRHRESFLNLVENYVDILFSNESEIKSLYETSTLESAVDQIKGRCKVAVITCGEDGSIILTKNEQINIPANNLGEVIDTTGAGDLYASGFLFGYLNNKDLATCGSIGSICAGQIITQLGSRCECSLIDIVRENVKSL